MDLCRQRRSSSVIPTVVEQPLHIITAMHMRMRFKKHMTPPPPIIQNLATIVQTDVFTDVKYSLL